MKLPIALILAFSLFLTGCHVLPTRASVYPSEASVDSIEPGASKTHVLQILGKPDSISVYRRQKEEVWQYSGLLLGGDDVWVIFSLTGQVTSVQKVPHVEDNFWFPD